MNYFKPKSGINLRLLIACAAVAFPDLSHARERIPTPEDVLANAARYTVKINVQTTTGLNADEMGEHSGTGFLIDRERGWFLTNAHVASRSPGKISVTFKDGKPIPARRVHVDTFMDVAVLEISPQKIPLSATIAALDCANLPQEGASVFAYGHPWGLDFTASRGIVSGFSWFSPQELIQTDASINHGNSGGPLIRVSDGKVVGISSHSYTDTEDKGATAVGLAQPMPATCHILDLLRQGKDASVKLLPIDVATRRKGHEPTVAGTSEQAPAFSPGDKIIRVNGSAEIRSYPDLVDRLRGIDGPVVITVQRGETQTEIRSPLKVIPNPLKDRALNVSGLVLSEPWRIDNAEVDPSGSLVVVDIKTESDLGASDVRVAYRLKYLNGRQFYHIEELYEYLNSIPKGAEIEMIFWQPADYTPFSGGHIVATVQRDKLEWIAPND